MKTRVISYCDQALGFCLYGLIFCLPFAKAGVETFCFMGIFLWLMKRALGHREDGLWHFFPSTPLNKPLAVFFIANALAVVFSLIFGLSFKALFSKILKFLMIYFMVVETFRDERRLKTLLLVLLASAALMSADGLYQYFTGKDFLRGYSWARMQASFISANGFGAWLIVMIPILIAVCFQKMKGFGWKLNILSALLAVSLGICLLLTYSRGAWVGFMVSAAFSIFYLLFFGRSWRMLAYVSTAGAIILAAGLLQNPLKERLESLGIHFRSMPSFFWRLKSSDPHVSRGVIWKESINMIEDFPVLGTGLNTYSLIARNYKMAQGGGTYPHNSYLQMAAETGLLGLCSFFWIVFAFFKTSWSYLKTCKDPLVLGLVSGILAFLVHAFFDNNLYSLQLVVLFWFMSGLTIAVINLRLAQPRP